jgi:O-glycosyl hydrolase
LQPQSAITLGSAQNGLRTISVGTATKQATEIAGFGGALTQSAAEAIDTSPNKHEILEDLFGTSGADFNLVRLPMGASDFITSKTYERSYEDSKGHFSVGTPASRNPALSDPCAVATSATTFAASTNPGDFADVIPVLRCVETTSIQPSLKILGTPWSAPSWMKNHDAYVASSCSGTGDELKPSQEAAYAQYLTQFAETYEGATIKLAIDELSLGNEPQNCATNYPTMLLTPAEEAQVAKDLHADLDSAHANGKLAVIPGILIYDHNWSCPPSGPAKGQYCAKGTVATTYPRAVLTDLGADDSYVSVVGFHHYNYAAQLPTLTEAAQSDVKSVDSHVGIWMTEATGTGAGLTSGAAGNLVWETQHDLIDPIRDGASASLYLNLALASGGQTHIGGCTDCRGMLTISDGVPSMNEDYYAWAQFSKWVEPGAKVIVPTISGSGLDAVAFQNPNGGPFVLVVLNTTSDAVTLSGVKQVVSGYGGGGYCAVLMSGGVDCWGYGADGELGDEVFDGSAVPVQVVSPTGSGTLSGVAGLVSDGLGYCAVLTSGEVDCWGYGADGELGNGTFYTSGNYGSAVPVQVVSPTGSGTLSGVASLVSDDDGIGYCAVLTSGGVDCWGYGADGELGDGVFDGSAVPVHVVSPTGSGTLSSVASLVKGGDGYCAVLTSGEVDCWGYGADGELGNGTFYTSGSYGSAVPVQVVSPTGSGTLSGVASLVSDGLGYCAVLTSGEVDCWGYGADGELGDGTFYTSGNGGSAVPVQVVSPTGSGTLSGVASLVSDDDGYCAVLTSGEVDCWGYGSYGELGNGVFDGSAVPVQVVSPTGSGTLSGVASLVSGASGYCAVLTSGEVDCWGYGADGELGNGTFYTSGNDGSAVPVQVVPPTGSGTLSGVASLVSGASGYCAVLTSGGVDCWGYGAHGELGDGTFYTSGNGGSAVPVQVVSPTGSGTLSGVASLVSGDDVLGYCAASTASSATGRSTPRETMAPPSPSRSSPDLNSGTDVNLWP